MKTLQKLKTFALTSVLVIAGLGAGTGTASADGLLEEIQKRGKLRVGMSTFVPWAMRDVNGELMGFEIDVATKVAEDIGVEVEFIPTAWSGIIPALIAKKFDLIIGGMSITRNEILRSTLLSRMHIPASRWPPARSWRVDSPPRMISTRRK